ncbi:MAG: (2Fe-2S)-binding protein [Chloroflexi bacterium]|nr:(2Fe-2S)-binding protein [Chloroflexota bacterium]
MMKTVSLTIDDKQIETQAGNTLLWAALDNGIYIPNLCSLRHAAAPAASCRLCWVEVEGKAQPVTACTEIAAEGMVANTRGTQALRLARNGFELLMASHPIECARCAALHVCELLKIAGHLNVKLNKNPYRKLVHHLPIDSSNPLFNYDPNKCVVCGRCVSICRERGTGVLGFAHRGFDRRATTFYDELIGDSACEQCGECVRACPSGALTFKVSVNV